MPLLRDSRPTPPLDGKRVRISRPAQHRDAEGVIGVARYAGVTSYPLPPSGYFTPAQRALHEYFVDPEDETCKPVTSGKRFTDEELKLVP